MKDLTQPRWMAFKGILFLFVGIVSATLLILECTELRVILLLALCIWSFCRAYYFAFYVVEKYVDPGYRFSGLWSFARYCISRGKG